MRDLSPRRALTDTGAGAVRGIALANIAFFLLAVGDASVVWALPVLGVAGAMFGRGAVGGATVAALALREPAEGPRGLRRLLPVRRGLVAFRSLVHTFASLTWYVAWSWGMGLADGYAVGYAAPLLMIVLAVPMLGERIGQGRLIATLVGFAGMLVMVRPGGDLWTPGTVLLLAGVVAMAISRNLTRVLATTETPECLAAWLLLAHIPVGAAVLALGLPPPRVDAATMICVLVLGLSNGLAHWLHSRACALAPMGALAPYEYVGLIWAVLLGWVLFQQMPEPATIGGALVVVAAGLFNLYRENGRRRAERAAPQAGAPPAPRPVLARRLEL